MWPTSRTLLNSFHKHLLNTYSLRCQRPRADEDTLPAQANAEKWWVRKPVVTVQYGQSYQALLMELYPRGTSAPSMTPHYHPVLPGSFSSGFLLATCWLFLTLSFLGVVVPLLLSRAWGEVGGFCLCESQALEPSPRGLGRGQGGRRVPLPNPELHQTPNQGFAQI